MTHERMANTIIGLLTAALILGIWAISDAAQAQDEISVWHDEERNVTCWETVNGLSCLPDWMIKPPAKALAQKEGARI